MTHTHGRNRFWARSSAGKYEPNVQELRRLFTEAPQLVERIRDFREGRLSLIRMGDTPVTVMEGTMLVVHLVPLSAFGLVQEVNLSDLRRRSGNIGPLGRSHPTHWEINFDGFLGLSNADPEKPHASYVQVFRNGAIEGVSHIEADDGKARYFHAARIETQCIGSTIRWAKVLAECGVEPPSVVLASVLNTKDRIMTSGAHGFTERKTIASAELHFAEVLVEKLASDGPEQARLLRKPLIEQIWNTIGLLSAPTFDQNGGWVPASTSW